MPRRKISIQEAMQVFRDNNLKVSVEPLVEIDRLSVTAVDNPVVRKVGNTALTITLNSQHTISSAGALSEDGKTVVGQSSVTYGPGRVTVPVTLASQLLHQDQLARQADERFREMVQRSYLITRKMSHDGYQATIGVQVDNSLFDNFGFNLKETMVI
ncbi:MAG: hypothetical protein ACRCZI_14930 [Cetobacterium sp.]